ncbi:MAG: hypothetical protein ACE5G2_01760 [Candidatus Krumholzibacteriia bacterium]
MLYTYVSGVPADLETGTFYPLTADGQPAFVLAGVLPATPTTAAPSAASSRISSHPNPTGAW